MIPKSKKYAFGAALFFLMMAVQKYYAVILSIVGSKDSGEALKELYDYLSL